jgi:hypothetical protein
MAKNNRGSKAKYTDKQKRQAEHIEEGYEDRGVSPKEAEKRAWATVNKIHGGGKKGGSGNKTDKSPMRKGDQKGGKNSGGRSKKNTTAQDRSSHNKKKAPPRKNHKKRTKLSKNKNK